MKKRNFLWHTKMKSWSYSGVNLTFYTYCISPIEKGLLWANTTTLKVGLVSLAFWLQKICDGSFKWDTKHWFWSRGSKDIRGQIWRSKKYLQTLPCSNRCNQGRSSLQSKCKNSIVHHCKLRSTSDFDLFTECLKYEKRAYSLRPKLSTKLFYEAKVPTSDGYSAM